MSLFKDIDDNLESIENLKTVQYSEVGKLIRGRNKLIIK